MYQGYPKGSVEHIQGLDINIPPVGWVYDPISGEMEKTGVYERSPVKAEQYWERKGLPDDWKKRRREEKKRQKYDNEYIDPILEEFRMDAWNKRLRGMWFKNNGRPTYITGSHYFYLNWWHLDSGHPDFREPDRRFFYFLQYCIEDPDCLGMIEVSKRKQGKTYRGGLFIYEAISRVSGVHGGIQSKTETDAGEVFKKAVVYPWKKLPDFFRPTYDTSQGSDPKTQLRFFAPSARGKRAEESIGVDELESWIDYKSSHRSGYDGPKLYRYLSDEWAKTETENIYERHATVREACTLDGEFIGKMFYTSTVEEISATNSEESLDLWNESDQDKRDGNNQTTSGLYRFFTPVQETMYYDKYGFPDGEKAIDWVANRMEALKHKPNALYSFLRKNPRKAEDAFRVSSDGCMFDAMKLSTRHDALSWRNPIELYETGEFVWKDGVRDSEVIWSPRKNGRVRARFLFTEGVGANDVGRHGSLPVPQNDIQFVIGVDPFDYDVVEDERNASDGCFYVYKKFDPNNQDFSDSFIMEYCYRPRYAAIFYEQVLMACRYFSCKALVESNKKGIVDYFKERNHHAFLMKLPNKKDYGIASSPNAKQHMAEITDEYIENNIDKVFFPELIEDWLKLDLQHTQKYDRAMAAGWTLVASKRFTMRQRRNASNKSVDSLFRRHKITKLSEVV